ncbi:family 43 glycosylhydrolase [Hymenobacter tibetensis]|uniref:Family 43 glycosylhydrolase n=1 Tax=Hymenobacter tibetensis TaxID=497967 RepID=A0ABY4D4G1_9BACT|nr:family 43 glycosylhydrolase [Hymenobacter tibetensis]UOG76410.1 family 43 glycosylhydrolase [Hymenobacter tibetensis]
MIVTLTNWVNKVTQPAHLRWPFSYIMLLLLIGWPSANVIAQQGDQRAHDPANIIKEGNKYWVFTTGQGIPSKYSTDLITWAFSSRPVFTPATRPSWITTRVPTFQNDYWAPECIFMNGKYYLYYSCSTFGSRVSGIGLATNVTLDPDSPNYNWVDEGEVISSNNNSAANAIDPAVYRDASNNLWFIYGSFFGGIRVLQLNPTTGKPINGSGTQQFAVANGDVEAAYVKQRGNYYYLFINRGSCCQGSNSTYYIQVGRSTSPTGPFLDKNGVDLNSNGGTVLMNRSGRYVGPGHAGIFEENGVSMFSYHYYDSNDNGTPKLGIAKLTWDATDWPVVSRDWVAPGRYEITGQNSGQLWQAGCAGAAGQAVSQGNRTGQACQQWDFVAAGNGEYTITNVQSGLTVGTASCSAANNAALQVGANTGATCQLFRLDRASDGTLVFASANGNRVAEVPFASMVPGTQLGLFDYNGCSCQRWTITPVGTLATARSQKLSDVTVYPVPAVQGNFTVELGTQRATEAATVVVFDLQGQVVYQESFRSQRNKLAVKAGLKPGMYQVQVRSGGASSTHRMSVL